MELKSLLLAVTLCTCTFNSFALAGFSRACGWDELPAAVEYPAVLAFDAMGAAGSRAVLDQAYRASRQQKGQYWIHESITTDYGSARYYLFAESRVYRLYDDPGYQVTPHQVAAYGSSGWVANKVAPELLEDSRLAIFFFNRKLLTSARSGHPNIVEHWPPARAGVRDEFTVIGRHAYYDPKSRVIGYLPGSKAGDCNLTEWGIESLGYLR